MGDPPGSKRRRNNMMAEKKKCVVFRFAAPHADRVFLAGSFNGWSPESHPLRRTKQGIWQGAVYLEPDLYEYRFVAEAYRADDAGRRKPFTNEFGSYNAVVRL
jgi:1,4-alpha-glucan branching enzyme